MALLVEKKGSVLNPFFYNSSIIVTNIMYSANIQHKEICSSLFIYYYLYIYLFIAVSACTWQVFHFQTIKSKTGSIYGN